MATEAVSRPMKHLALPLAVLTASAVLITAPSQAAIIVGTGVGKTPGPGVQDDNWQVVAVPSSTVPGAVPTAFPLTPPYYAYVPATVSPAWLGGSSNIGDGTNRWVSLYNNSNQSAFTFGNWQPYSFVLAQSFTIDTDGLYTFNFLGSGDDYMAFYINGTVQNVAPTASNPADQAWYDARVDNFPTVVGGTQIMTSNPAMPGIGGWGFPFGSSPSYDGIAGTSGNGNFGFLSTFTGTVFLTAGTHTAYSVVYDTGGEAGALIGTSSFGPAAEVPEPGTLAVGALLVGGVGLMHWRRRRGA